MAITYKTQGIILNYKDYKETDRLYTIFTLDHGKLLLRAQGVKKINSKLAGHLETLNNCELFIAQGKVFSRIGGAQVSKSYQNIKNDIDKLKLVNTSINILDDLLGGQEEDKQIFILLSDFLDWCNNHKIIEYIKQSFLLKLLNILGYQPDFSKSSGEIAKILNFLSKDQWENIEKLRLNSTQWQKLNLVLNSFIKQYLSDNLQTKKILL